jgi:hypothetical protein
MANWCVLEMEPTGMRPQAATWFPGVALDLPDSRLSSAEYRATWGVWLGREAEFYVECSQRFDKSTWEDVTSAGGVLLRAALADLVAAHREYKKVSIPTKLRPAALRVVGQTDDAVRVVTYSATDPLEIPRALWDALYRFDGRERVKVLAELDDEMGLVLDDPLVQRLVDFRVLLNADDVASR